MTPLDEMLLEVVRLIPRGSLVSYADLSSLAGELGYPCTARRVARTLSLYGSEVPWWRVVQSGGTLADPVRSHAQVRLREEGVLVTGRRVPLNQHRWDPDPAALREALGSAASGLPAHGHRHS